MQTKQAYKIPAYLVEVKSKKPEYTNGLVHGTEFHRGRGVCDERSLALARRDSTRPEMKPEFIGARIEELAKYWGEHGATVTSINAQVAELERTKIQKANRDAR